MSNSLDIFLGEHASQRRAKIVCTIGPASNSEEMIRQLMLSGMDVARLNFSHGTHEDHAVVILRLRKVAAELKRTICILQDLQGPKIRTGRLRTDRIAIALQNGPMVTITSNDVLGTVRAHRDYLSGLARDVKPGEHILLSDGRIEFVITEDRQWQRGLPGAEWRHAGRASGDQPAGDESQHSVAYGEG